MLRSLASTSRECQFSSRVIFPILHSIEIRKKILLLVWNIYIAVYLWNFPSLSPYEKKLLEEVGNGGRGNKRDG